MYTPPYIPRADDAFRDWAQVFCNGLNRNPALYGMAAAETQGLVHDFDLFKVAYGVAVDPERRTRQAIIDKDDARSILEDLCRKYAAHIRANLGITDGDKVNIGVRPRNIARNKRTASTAPPLLEYVGSLPGVDEVRFRDSSAPDSRAKPYGAERLELWVGYSRAGEPIPKREDARLVGTFKKSKMLVDQDLQRDVRQGASGPGTGMPTYWARWLGCDGTVSPWSLPLFTTGRRAATAETAKPVETQVDADDDRELKMAA